MLNQELIDQTKSVLERLTGTVELTFELPAPGSELFEESQSWASSLTGLHPRLVAHQIAGSFTFPTLKISRANGSVAVEFHGLPGGHEYSSLILSILHVHGDAKQPDAGMLQRAQSLQPQAPTTVEVAVSLSCENCPEVVQALSWVALRNPQISLRVIDGGVRPDFVETRSVQAVPAVFIESDMISVGRSNLGQLVETLEKRWGSRHQAVHLGRFDVLVVGGGPAGASAAIYSARKGLKTAILADRIGGQLLETKGIQNMISMTQTEGPKLSADLVQHLRDYPIEILEHRRVQTLTPGEPHHMVLSSGETVEADRVVIATGAQWRRLGVPGEENYIGRGVAFCAHCDGPFFKEKHVAVVGGGNSGVEAALDLAELAHRVDLYEVGASLRADEVLVKKLMSHPKVHVHLQSRLSEVLGDEQKVVGIRWTDAESQTQQMDLDGVFVQIGLKPNTDWVKGILELNGRGEIVVDGRGRTNVPGVYAAGDVTPLPFKQIITAMGDGAKVALSLYEDRMAV